ncbi:MAG: hypothetical protein GY772_17590 [bacterium]|nr:hypothetical protein [bacterium]
MSSGITEANIEAFRAAYAACTGEVFFFEGREVLKRYAYYVIRYWDDPEGSSQLGRALGAVSRDAAAFALLRTRTPPWNEEPN